MPEHVKAFNEAQAAYDSAIKQLIADEMIATWVPSLKVTEEKAKARYEAACEALAGPEADLAELGARIAGAEAKRAERQAQLDAPGLDPDERGPLRWKIAEWDREIAELEQKRAFAEAERLPILDAKARAAADMEEAKEFKLAFAGSLAAPYESLAGQCTQAYFTFRRERLVYVLLAGNRDHPEWDSAIGLLRQCALAARWRTDDLPSLAEIDAAAMTAAMHNASAEAPAPAPSMVDVVKLTEVEMENNALQQRAQHDLVEDRRHAAGPRTLVQQRSYMEVPRMSEYLR